MQSSTASEATNHLSTALKAAAAAAVSAAERVSFHVSL